MAKLGEKRCAKITTVGNGIDDQKLFSTGAVLIPNKLKKQSSGLRLLLWDCSLSALITELNELETVPKMIKKIEMSHFNISSWSSVVLGSQHSNTTIFYCYN